LRNATQILADTRARLEGIRGVKLPDENLIKWQRRSMLAISILPPLGLLFAAIQLWGWGITLRDVVIATAFYVVTGLGITVGFHRLFTHKSFAVPGPVRVFWAIAGSLAIQGSVIDWVATHRRHHAYSDEFGDPHSPHLEAAEGISGVLRGLWHAHLGWMFVPSGTDAQTWAPDLLDEPAIVKVNRWFPWLILVSFVAPAVVGGLWAGSLTGALTAFVWGGLIRVFLLHHVTWSINSICHFYGTRPFMSHDESRNNLFLSFLSFGESWHNAHHAFPASARHGLRWWEFDPSWVTIRAMQLVGIARNVKVPSPSQLARKTRRRAVVQV
jgi:stearoyl-CoA desaturase (delta-9 desaturase)